MSKRILTATIIIVLLSMIVSCSGKHPAKLVGTWDRTAGDITWSDRIVFGSNGSGAMSVESLWGGSTTIPITWRVEKKKLYIFAEGITPEYEYTLSKSELTLRTSFLGSPIMAVYRKQR